MARYCHHLVKKTAQEMAGAFYEHAAGQDNDFYRLFPNQKDFIRERWGDFTDVAKRILAGMLNGPYPEAMKVDIADALFKEWTLPAGDTSITPHGARH